MAREAEAVEITDFSGIILNADPRDVEDGAAIDQVNATSLVPGELRVRGGVVAVNFEEF